MFDEAEDGIRKTVERRMSASFIAPAGSGKTVVLRALRQRLAEARYHVSYIKVTNLSQRDMCREIASAVGAKPSGLYNALVRNIQERFDEDFSRDGRRPVLIIDEAHEMRPLTISILKLLTNFEMDSRLVVSFILAGQERLRDILNDPTFSDISTRIFHHSELRLLSRDESLEYLRFRCLSQGIEPLPFDDSSVAAIFELARGNMRAMNHLALKSLEIACEKQLSAVDQSIIIQAKKHLWL